MSAVTPLAPIALFVYNRPEHTRRTVEALQANHLAADSDLFVFSDAPKTEAATEAVFAVRRYVDGIGGFRSVTVVKKAKNCGVDPSIIDGVTQLCESHGRVIVLEDDLVTAPWFLHYVNRALTLYQDEAAVMQISGFMFPLEGTNHANASFLPYATCWGWATWKSKWQMFDPSARGFDLLKADKALRQRFNLDGAYDYFQLLKEYMERKNDAWDIRWYLSIFLRGGLTLFPQQSLVHNIGFDGSGVHCPPSDFAGSQLYDERIDGFPVVQLDAELWSEVKRYLLSQKESRTRQMSRLVRSMLPIRSVKALLRLQTE